MEGRGGQQPAQPGGAGPPRQRARPRIHARRRRLLLGAAAFRGQGLKVGLEEVGLEQPRSAGMAHRAALPGFPPTQPARPVHTPAAEHAKRPQTCFPVTAASCYENIGGRSDGRACVRPGTGCACADATVVCAPSEHGERVCCGLFVTAGPAERERRRLAGGGAQAQRGHAAQHGAALQAAGHLPAAGAGCGWPHPNPSCNPSPSLRPAAAYTLRTCKSALKDESVGWHTCRQAGSAGLLSHHSRACRAYRARRLSAADAHAWACVRARRGGACCWRRTT